MDDNMNILIKMCKEIVKNIDYRYGPLVLNCRELLSLIFQNK
jgi:hypothetical protein